MNYKVTLAMPVYNVEKYVERALISALNQTFDSIEFLIIDDKGTDASMDIVREIVSKHPRGKHVRIIDHIVNQGTGATRNTAIKEAKGEYFFFMDSDDEITPNCIQLLYETMLHTPSDVVIGSYQLCDEVGKIINTKLLPDKKYNGMYKLGDDFFDKKNIYVQTWNKLYNVAFLRKNNIVCIPSHINEDILFTFQIVLHATSCILKSDITYTYYLLKDSTTNEQRESGGYTFKLAKQYMEIIQYKKYCLTKYPNAINCLGIADDIVGSAIDYSLKMYSSDIDKKQKKEYLKICMDFTNIYKLVYPKLKAKRNIYFLSIIQVSSNFCYRFIVLACLKFVITVKRRFSRCHVG